MKFLLENWRGYLDEDKSTIEPFRVTKRDKKIKGKNHYVITHTPSNMYIPSHLYKMGRKNVQGLADELNAYNTENEGLFKTSDLPSDEIALKTVLAIIEASPYREDVA